MEKRVPIGIELKARGGPAVQAALRAVTADAGGIASGAGAATAAARELESALIKAGAASHWDAVTGQANMAAKALKDAAEAQKQADRETTLSAKQAEKEKAEAARESARAAVQASRDAAQAAKQADREAAQAAREAAKATKAAALDSGNAQKALLRDLAVAASQTASRNAQTAREAAQAAKAAARDAASVQNQAARESARAVADSQRQIAQAARDSAAAQKASIRDAAQARAIADRKAAQDARDTARAQSDAARDYAKAQRQAQRDVAQAQRDTARAAKDLNNQLVKAGAASHWSPAISAARQAATAINSANAPAVTLQRHLAAIVATARQIGPALRNSSMTGSGALMALAPHAQALNGSIQQYQNNRGQFGALEGASQGAVMLGGGMAAAGLAGFAVAGKSAIDAGEYQKLRNSYRLALGEERGDKFMQEVVTSRYARVFGARNALETAATQLTTGGFSADDLLNARGTGLYQTVGAMASQGKAKPEGVAEAMRQISQVRRKTRAEKNDLDVIAESGGIDVYGLIEAKFGKPRLTEVLEGKKPLTYDELKGALDTASTYKGGMFAKGFESAENSLPGQIEALRGSFYLLSADLGQYVIPLVSFAARTVTFLADGFRNLNPVAKGALVYTGLLGGGLLVLGGGLIAAAGMAGIAFVGISALNGAMATTPVAAGAATAGVRMLSLSALPAMVGKLAMAGRAILAFSVAVGAAVYAWNLYANELKKPTETAPDKRLAGERAQDAANAKAVDKIVGQAMADSGINERGKIEVLAMASKKAGDMGDTDAALRYANQRAELARRAPAGPASGQERYVSQLRDMSGFYRPEGIIQRAERTPATPEDAAKRQMAETQRQMDDWQRQMERLPKNLQPGGVFPVPGGAPMPMPAPVMPMSMAPTAPLAGLEMLHQLDALRDQKSALEGKENKEARAAIARQITGIQRGQRDRRVMEAEERKAEAERRRAEIAQRRDLTMQASAEIAQVQAGRDVRVSDVQERKSGALRTLDERRDMAVEELRAGANKYNRRAVAAQIRALNREYEQQKAAIEADARREIAAIRAGVIRQSGAIRASVQTGVAAQTTLAIANARAGAVALTAPRTQREMPGTPGTPPPTTGNALRDALAQQERAAAALTGAQRAAAREMALAQRETPRDIAATPVERRAPATPNMAAAERAAQQRAQAILTPAIEAKRRADAEVARVRGTVQPPTPVAPGGIKMQVQLADYPTAPKAPGVGALPNLAAFMRAGAPGVAYAGANRGALGGVAPMDGGAATLEAPAAPATGGNTRITAPLDARATLTPHGVTIEFIAPDPVHVDLNGAVTARSVVGVRR